MAAVQIKCTGIRCPLAPANARVPELTPITVNGGDHGFDFGSSFASADRVLDFLFDFRKSTLVACRADASICGDVGNDCCAPGSKLRSCALPGYIVTPGGPSAGSCASTFGEAAIYQCCPPAVEIGHRPRISYNSASAECSASGKALCTVAQLCPNGAAFDGGVSAAAGGRVNFPVADGIDEWVQFGAHPETDQCQLHSAIFAPDPHPCHTEADPVPYPDQPTCGNEWLYCCSPSVMPPAQPPLASPLPTPPPPTLPTACGSGGDGCGGGSGGDSSDGGGDGAGLRG